MVDVRAGEKGEKGCTHTDESSAMVKDFLTSSHVTSQNSVR